jgi:hypothetical protein
MTVRATQELTAEHRVIEDVLAALDRAVTDAAGTRVVPAAFLRGVDRHTRRPGAARAVHRAALIGRRRDRQSDIGLMRRGPAGASV